MNEAVLVEANQKRSGEAAARRAAEADRALRILDTRPALHARPVHQIHRDALYLRASKPKASLRELAAEIGVGKDVFAARLRRALHYATRMEAQWR